MNSDTIRKQFTGYERDGETGLDFAQARYFQSSHGRFSSPDQLAASANPIRPQSWNRYSYVYNNPYRYNDPTGMTSVPADYWDLDGIYLGSDGNASDTNLYIVNRGGSSGNPAPELRPDNAIATIPNTAIRDEILDLETRSNAKTADDKKGGFHEEAVSWNTKDGATTPQREPAGKYVDPSSDFAAEMTLPGDADGVAHAHQKGTVRKEVEIGGQKYLKVSGTEQIPSEMDVASASTSRTQIMVAAGEKRVYIYSTKEQNNATCRCIGYMTINAFKKVGVRR